MDATSPSDTSTFQVNLKIGNRTAHAELTVPNRPIHPGEMLPLLQALTSSVTDLAGETAEEGGERISCRKGCGACCRQLVPVSLSEARRLRDLVNELPEPRRGEIRARFADAVRRLEQSGLPKELTERKARTPQEAQDLGMRYFRQSIPCPFLEEESCSIHPDRPIRCREYLVTSPAEHCAQPSAETVRMVPMPLKLSPAVYSLDRAEGQPLPWVPLTLALAWADANPRESPMRPGPELLRQVLGLLGKETAEPGDQPIG